MHRAIQGRRWWVAGSLALLPIVAPSQSPFALDTKPVMKNTVVVGGQATMELIRLDGKSITAPLRYPGVVRASEIVDLDGKVLTRDQDYAVDYAGGILYFMRPVRSGQIVRVSYRHRPEGAATNGATPQNFAGMNGPSTMQFNILPKSGLIVGLGMAERMADGTVVSSNVYGLQSNYQFTGGAIRGLFVVGERKKVQRQSMYEPDSKASNSPADEGRSQALLQSISANALGGQIQLDYQDVREKFAGFQAFRDAGYQESVINQLKKERGLKRASFAVSQVGSKGFNFSHSYRTVEDKDGQIESRSFGLNVGPMTLKWAGDRVGSGFQRFADLAEADREMLAREKGMSRETLMGSLEYRGTKGTFEAKKIEAEDGSGIYRRSLSLATPRLTLSFSDQQVEKEFTRFGALREPDAGQLAKEAGVSRQNLSFQAEPTNRSKVHYANSVLRTQAGDFQAVDYGLQLGAFGIEYLGRRADSGLAKLGVMPDQEIATHIQAIKRMYEPQDFNTKPEEKVGFLQSPGLERSLLRFQATPTKGWALSCDDLRIGAEKGGARVATYRLSSPTTQFSFRSQRVDEDFDRLGGLMEFERARLGTIAGLDRTDLTLSTQVNAKTRLAMSQMKASAPEGEATRATLGLVTPGLELSYARRHVEAGFLSIGQIADPERDVLKGMIGFDQVDLLAKWRILRNLNLDLKWFDARKDNDEEQRVWRETTLSWQPDRFTSITLFRQRQRFDSPLDLLNAMDRDRMSFARDFGALGRLRYVKETVDFDGTDAQVRPDTETTIWGYETKLSQHADFKAERQETKFSNGETEKVDTNSITAKLQKNVGVSVSDTKINRDGDKPDETKRNYGLWWDLGHGLRINYGHVRSLIENKDGEGTSEITVTPGSVGDVKVESANYRTQTWDNQRHLATGNVRVGTVRPIRLGPFQNFEFMYAVDTVRDRFAWQRENRALAFGFQFLGAAIKYEQKSQIHPSGFRGLDRALSVSTDQSESKPLRASVYMKKRSQPWADDFFIRNYSIAWRVTPGLEVRHQLVTNPEEFKGDAMLGSNPKGDRSAKWVLDFTRMRGAHCALSWEELKNDVNHNLSRTMGLNVTLNPHNPSPLQLFYGMEMRDVNGERRAEHRYWLRYDQRPGPNQSLSLFIGNLNWQYSRPQDQRIHNWTIRFDYQLKF